MPSPIKDVIFQVTPTGAGPVTPITFPTAFVAKTQGTNTQRAVNPVDAIVLAANANRKFAMIVNISGSTVYLSFGAAATAASVQLPSGAAYIVDGNTIGEINQQAIHVIAPSGAAVVGVIEEV